MGLAVTAALGTTPCLVNPNQIFRYTTQNANKHDDRWQMTDGINV